MPKVSRKRQLVPQLWLTLGAKNVHRLDAMRGETYRAELHSQIAFQLADTLAGDKSEGCIFGRASESVAGVLGFSPEGPITGGPRAKLTEITATVDSVKLNRRCEALAKK